MSDREVRGEPVATSSPSLANRLDELRRQKDRNRRSSTAASGSPARGSPGVDMPAGSSSTRAPGWRDSMSNVLHRSGDSHSSSNGRANGTHARGYDPNEDDELAGIMANASVGNGTPPPAGYKFKPMSPFALPRVGGHNGKDGLSGSFEESIRGPGARPTAVRSESSSLETVTSSSTNESSRTLRRLKVESGELRDHPKRRIFFDEEESDEEDAEVEVLIGDDEDVSDTDGSNSTMSEVRSQASSRREMIATGLEKLQQSSQIMDPSGTLSQNGRVSPFRMIRTFDEDHDDDKGDGGKEMPKRLQSYTSWRAGDAGAPSRLLAATSTNSMFSVLSSGSHEREKGGVPRAASRLGGRFRPLSRVDNREDGSTHDAEIAALENRMTNLRTFIDKIANKRRYARTINKLYRNEPSGDLRVRLASLKELHQMEINFIGDMRLLVHEYYVPLRNGDLVTSAQVNDIFGSIITLIGHAILFKESLDKVLVSDTAAATTDISEPFATIQSYFAAYASYVRNTDLALETVERQKKNGDFRKFLEMKQRLCERAITDLLLRPLERLPLMAHVVDRLLKHVPRSEKAFAYVSDAQGQISEVLNLINKKKHDVENRQYMEDLQQQFAGEAPLIVSENRVFIREGPLFKIGRRFKMGALRYAFLFSDSLIMTEFLPQAALPHRLKSIVELHGATIERRPATQRGEDTVFRLVSGQTAVTLRATSEYDCTEWVEDIREAIESCARRLRSTDSSHALLSQLRSGSMSRRALLDKARSSGKSVEDLASMTDEELTSVCVEAEGTPRLSEITVESVVRDVAKIVDEGRSESDVNDVRDAVMVEMYGSERAFLRDLETTVAVFRDPLLGEDAHQVYSTVLSREEVLSLFTSIDTVIQNSAIMLQALGKCNTTDEWRWAEELHKAIVKALKGLLKYSRSFDGAVCRLMDWRSSRDDFAEFLIAREGEKGYLKDFLDYPVQRLLQYRILLERLLPCTEATDPSFESIAKVNEEIRDTIEKMDIFEGEDMNEDTFHATYITEIQGRVLGECPNLVVPGRRFVNEGAVAKVGRRLKGVTPRYLYLFNDILLIAEPVGQAIPGDEQLQQQRFKQIVNLASATIEPVTEGKRPAPAFRVNVANGDKVTMRCETISDRDNWIADISEAIDRLKQGNDSEGEDGGKVQYIC